jgi:peptide chain release factor subunit 1
MPILDHLSAQLDRLSTLDPGPYPVLSLYLNLQADDRGRDNFGAFLRKEFAERTRGYAANGPERESLNGDREKISKYLSTVPPSANGLAIFASSGANLFEAILFDAPVSRHQLIISDQPHLYPLAQIVDAYPRYAVVLADTQLARIFVFAENTVERRERVESDKTKRHKMGGWAQARYQRHVDHDRLLHAKDVVDHLARIVRAERIEKVILAGDDVIMPMLRDQLPKEVADRVIDVAHLDIRSPEHEILAVTRERLRQADARDDRERVDVAVGGYRAGGLGAVGFEPVRKALELGQVDELLINGQAGELDTATADELMTLARRVSAKIRFIEDASLLAPFGGVAAILRFKL